MNAISLAMDGDLDVANNYARRDEDAFYARAPRPKGFTGQSAPYPLTPDLIRSPARPDSESYSYHPPGLGLALVPAWIAGSWFDLEWPATVVFMCLVGALVGLNVFLLAYEATADARVACLTWAALAFSAPLMSYSVLIFSEVPASLLVLYAFRRFSAPAETNRPWQWALAGMSVAALPWISWRCGLIAVPLGIQGAAQWWRARAPAASKRRAALLLAGPSLLSLAALALYARFLTGAWILDIKRRAGYQMEVFHWPWAGPIDLRLFARGMTALFLDQQWGLLVHSPIYLLGLAGILVASRSGEPANRRALRWIGIVAAPYLLLMAAFEHWGGLWCPPGRYLVPVIPLLALPLALSLRDLAGSRLYKLVFLLLAGLGFGYVVLVNQDFHLLWPTERGYFWAWLSGLLPVKVDLRDWLPAFAWPGDRHPWQVAALLGACVAVALWVDVLSGRRAPAGSRRARALGWTAGLAILTGGWYLADDELLGAPRLVPGRSWSLWPPLVQVEGAAVLAGSVFVADYRGGAVWTMELATGAWKRLQARTGAGPIDFFHPGDVVAREGRLWILNNGPEASALLELRPGGEVVRQVALGGRSEIATGLAFGGAGLFLSDMLGGQLREYRVQGGDPVRSWPEGGLNNPASVATGPDGALFVAESSEKHVLEYGPGGRLRRRFEVGCSPRRLAVDGGWLDGCCDGRLFSVELRTGSVKRFRIPRHGIQQAQSLAHGPDRTLYLIDSRVLAEFRVER